MDTVDHLRNMIIEEFELDPDKVQPDTDLTALGIDSLSVIEFLFKVEDTFKVTLPDRRVEEMKGPNPDINIRGMFSWAKPGDTQLHHPRTCRPTG